jgi:CBS domain containing-hemolysin-like protein
VTDLFYAAGGIVVLLALDLVGIAARMSFLQITQARLLMQRDEFGARVQTTLGLLTKLPRLRASLNLLLVLTRFLIAGISLLFIFTRPVTYPWLAAGIGLFVTALLVFWLEWAVERVVTRNPEVWAIRLTGFVRVLMALVGLLLVPLALSDALQKPADATGGVTEDDLKSLVDAGQEEGVFEKAEQQMIYSVFELGDTLAREIMVPRIDMLALDVDTPLVQAVDAILQAGYSRVPVYEESVDNTLGLLYAKDLLRAWQESDQVETLHRLLRPAYFVPEGKKLDELMAEMRTHRIHMAIVVDEYGGVAGLVTLEDIVEEIFGEIRDEYDQGEEAPYQKLHDEGYLFLGRIALDDFNEIMGSELVSDEADSLGGYIYDCLGRVPNVGETIHQDRLLLTVEQVSARQIRKVSARWLPLETHTEPIRDGEDDEHSQQ